MGQTSPRISITGLAETGLVTAGVLAVAATLAGFAGRSWWFLDLFAHFRVQYALLLVLAGGILVWRKRQRLAALMAGGLLLNVAVFGPYLIPPRTPMEQAGSVRCRLASINVNSANTRSDLVIDWIRSAKPDVVVLEEVTPRWMAELAVLHDLYPWRMDRSEEGNFGIALLSRYPLEDATVMHLADREPLSVSARVRVGDEILLRVIGVHTVPPGSRQYAGLRNEQLAALAKTVSAETGPVAVLGDLNLSPWSPHFRALLRQSGLRDTARGRGIRPTWPAGLWWLSIPIDHALVSGDVAVADRQVGSGVGSDHFPLLVDLLVGGGR